MVGTPKRWDFHWKGLRGAPRPGFADLEVEDAGVALLEALPVRHHAVQEGLVEGQRGDGRQQPAVTWAGPKPPNSWRNHPQKTPDRGGRKDGGSSPSAPWQMSVRVAPSTMNCGRGHSSCGENFGMFTHSHGISARMGRDRRRAHRGPLPLHPAGFGGAGAQLAEAQRGGGRGEGGVTEQSPGAAALLGQLLEILAQVTHGVVVPAQPQLLGSLPLHLSRDACAEHRHHRRLRHPATGNRIRKNPGRWGSSRGGFGENILGIWGEVGSRCVLQGDSGWISGF